MTGNLKNKVAFIGLGVMGFPMAGHLQRNRCEVVVFNRTETKARQWVNTYGGGMATSIAAAVTDADVVFSCVGNDDDVRSITLGGKSAGGQPFDGAFSAMKPGSYFVDHTTASASLARELYAAAQQRGIAFLDAPISGGQAGAEKGQLSIMVGGDEAHFNAIQPVIQHYAKIAKRIGPVGSGQLCKMVNQVCIAGLLQGLAEGLHFAEQAELDIDTVVSVISHGAAQSWQMDNRFHTMRDNQYDFGFAVDWMRKDLSIVLNEARRNGSHLPVTALVDQFYSEVQQLGGGRWDTSSLLARLRTAKNKSSQ